MMNLMRTRRMGQMLNIQLRISCKSSVGHISGDEAEVIVGERARKRRQIEARRTKKVSTMVFIEDRKRNKSHLQKSKDVPKPCVWVTTEY